MALPGPGQYLVTFRYRPTPALLGLAVSGLAGVGLGVWVALEVARVVRRRRSGRSRTVARSDITRG